MALYACAVGPEAQPQYRWEVSPTIGYAVPMTVQKLSISVPPEVAETIKAAAAREGVPVSAWLTQAAVEKAQLDARNAEGRAAALEMVAEYEKEHGPISDEERNRTHEFLRGLGLLDPEPQLVAG
jgi:hypothetical protein